MYRDSLCNECKQPIYWVYDVRNSQYFTLDPDAPNCIACELLESDDNKPEPGDKRRIKNLMFDDD